MTPGFEERVLYYLDTQGGVASDGTLLTEMDRVMGPLTQGAHHIWLEVLMNKKEDLVRGDGTLSIQRGSDAVTLNADGKWDPTPRDVGRELWIKGQQYEVVSVDTAKRELKIVPPCTSASDTRAPYAMGGVRVGATWQVRLPTSLVILVEERKKLMSDIATGTHLP